MAYTHPIAWLCLIDTVWLHASNGFENKVITWWRHQMETISALLALCEGNSPATGEFPSQSQRRGALMFFFICAWTNGWVNNRDAGDLRRHRAHYDITVMYSDVTWQARRLKSLGIRLFFQPFV